MKTRISLFTLIIMVIPFTFISDTNPQITSKIKVCVEVKSDKEKTDLDNRLEILLRRELRSLGDIDLVGIDTDWNFLLKYSIIENTFVDGRKTGWLTIASAIMGAHYLINYKTYGIQGVGKPAILLGVLPASYKVNDLHGYAIHNIGNFDKTALETYREVLKR